MNQHSLELARQAVALLRDALDGRAGLPNGNSRVVLVTSELAVHLLHNHADVDEIMRDLNEMDTVLADRLADRLLEDVDLDRFDWTT